MDQDLGKLQYPFMPQRGTIVTNLQKQTIGKNQRRKKEKTLQKSNVYL